MSYGTGHNEELVGRAVAGQRDEVVLATKFGIVRGENGVRLDGRPENVQAYCDASLKRLGVDSIDLYYLHRVDPDVPLADTIGAMGELVRSGKVSHLGVSEVNPEQLRQAAAGPDVVPIPGTRTAARAADNARAGDLVLDASDLRRIDALVPREGWGGDRMSFAAHGQARSPGSRSQPRTSAKAL